MSKAYVTDLPFYLFAFSVNIYSFIIINQLGWLTTILHINRYELVISGIPYFVIKQSITKYEKVSVWCLCGFLGIILTLSLAFTITGVICESHEGDLTVCEVSYSLLLVLIYTKLVMYIIFFVAHILLFMNLSNALKLHLNHYFTKTRKDLLLLTIGSGSYFFITIVISLLDYLFNDDWQVRGDMFACTTQFQKGIVALIGSESDYGKLALVIIKFITFVTYVVFNIRNINFKKYLHDIMVGYDISFQYDGASFYIRRSCFRPKPESEIDETLRATELIDEYTLYDDIEQGRVSFNRLDKISSIVYQ